MYVKFEFKAEHSNIHQTPQIAKDILQQTYNQKKHIAIVSLFLCFVECLYQFEVFGA